MHQNIKKVHGMKKGLFIFILIIVLAGMGGLNDAAWAKLVTSSPGNFSIQMPGNPKVTEKKHKSFIGNVPETNYHLKLGKTSYTASFSDLPGAALFFEGPKGIMKKAKRNFLKNSGAQQVSYQLESFKNHPGSLLVFKIPKNSQGPAKEGMARFFMVDKRLYVLVVTRTQSMSQTLASRYFNSFRFLKSPVKG